MLRTLVERIELVPNADELAIVLRGDLAAILTFACGKKNPDFLEQTVVLEELMGEAAVSGARKRKKPRGGGFCGSQGSLVAGASFHHYLRTMQVMMVAGLTQEISSYLSMTTGATQQLPSAPHDGLFVAQA